MVALLVASLLSIGMWRAPSTAASSSTAAAPAWQAYGSAEQVYVVHFPTADAAELVSSSGKVVSAENPAGQSVRTQPPDSLGGLVFRSVAPGAGYRVRDVKTGAESAPVTVHTESAAPWDPATYHQTIKDSGYQYLTTRDGIQLAIDVHPPTSPAGEHETLPNGTSLQLGLPTGTTLPPGPDFAPPYPTVIEYAGYGYADPTGPQSGIAVLANLMGFAVVDVNMRGTGCSGGAYDFFTPLQDLDGYDVIQTIASQPWVLGHKVGMIGISYGAISQLFTAQLDPPALEAIAPLSTIDATASTLYPGGILNTGFAVDWAAQRQTNAEPAGPHGGQTWAYKRIEAGTQTCEANQALHGEATSLMAKIDANDYYDPPVANPLDPTSFVTKIHVPVFLACQWEDGQTGGQCPDLVQHFTGTNLKWFTFTNGAHIDSLDPDTYDRWYDFLELFVAHRAPIVNAAVVHAAAPVVYQSAMGLPQTDLVTLPATPIQQLPTYGAALAAFERTPEIRVLFTNGAGTSPTGQQTAGNPYPAFEQGFTAASQSGSGAEPGALVSGTAAQTWYLQPGTQGVLGTSAPSTKGVDEYTANASTLPLTDYQGTTEAGGLWGDASQWQWNWEQGPKGTAVSWVSAPLAHDTTVIGSGAVYVWVKSSTPDVDLQATVSEVRPDGNETFVQDGWLRASERKLSTGTQNELDQPSTLLEPVPSYAASDVAPVPSNRFVRVAIPLYYEGHVYRAGSRIRLTISAPNGTLPVWSFGDTEPPLGTSAAVEIAMSRAMPSSLVLPVVSGVSVPTGAPACPSLRSEPCRPYVQFANEVVTTTSSGTQGHGCAACQSAASAPTAPAGPALPASLPGATAAPAPTPGTSTQGSPASHTPSTPGNPASRTPSTLLPGVRL
ncbi:MAG: CocE/NonD family hydrolase [Acidimicrobiales bacterium]